MDVEFEKQLSRVASVQRDKGWSEDSILSYREEIIKCWGTSLPSCVTIGAGLAQDNRRHGVFN